MSKDPINAGGLLRQPSDDKGLRKEVEFLAMLDDPAIAQAMAEASGETPEALRRLAAARVQAHRQNVASEANTVEPQHQVQPEPGLLKTESKADQVPPTSPQADKATRTENEVENNEIMTARGAADTYIVPPEIEREFVRVGNQFYLPTKKREPDLGFVDKGNKLETRSNDEQVAEAMVRIAQARGWSEIKVTGTETFRREAWLQAQQLGMEVRGYTPSETDHAEAQQRKINGPAVRFTAAIPQQQGQQGEAQTEKATAQPAQAGTLRDRDLAKAFAAKGAQAAEDHPELAGAAAALQAIDKQVGGSPLSERERKVVMDRVRTNLTNSIERGERPALKSTSQQGQQAQTQHQEEIEL